MIKGNVKVRNFWIASPDVGNHAPYWSDASLKHKATFMGYHPNKREHHQIGHTFARVVAPNDILLIARRHHNKPELVALGIVTGNFKTELEGFTPEYRFGSLRQLQPFKQLTAGAAPKGVMRVFRHTTALRKPDPARKSHRTIRNWMARTLDQKTNAMEDKSAEQEIGLRLRALHEHEGELEYEVRTRKKVTLAEQKETALVNAYQGWSNRRKRELSVASYKGLRCDAYEKDRGKLIEAKCSVKREYIRMAVGPLPITSISEDSISASPIWRSSFQEGRIRSYSFGFASRTFMLYGSRNASSTITQAVYSPSFRRSPGVSVIKLLNFASHGAPKAGPTFPVANFLAYTHRRNTSRLSRLDLDRNRRGPRRNDRASRDACPPGHRHRDGRRSCRFSSRTRGALARHAGRADH